MDTLSRNLPPDHAKNISAPCAHPSPKKSWAFKRRDYPNVGSLRRVGGWDSKIATFGSRPLESQNGKTSRNDKCIPKPTKLNAFTYTYIYMHIIVRIYKNQRSAVPRSPLAILALRAAVEKVDLCGAPVQWGGQRRDDQPLEVGHRHDACQREKAWDQLAPSKAWFLEGHGKPAILRGVASGFVSGFVSGGFSPPPPHFKPQVDWS